MKIKYFLFGVKTDVCMFSYTSYQKYLGQKFERVYDYRKADIIICSFLQDIIDSLKCFTELANSCRAKFILLSEEPLWDAFSRHTIKDLKQKYINLNIKGSNCKIYLINHLNSDVFSYDKIPYFLTTNKNYIINYINTLRSLPEIDSDKALSLWLKKQYNFVSLGKDLSNEANYTFRGSDQIPILSSIRSRYSKEICDSLDNCLLYGDKQETLARKLSSTIYESKKSALWHHQKLVFLRNNAKSIMCSENSVCENYITEKVFDAMVSLSIPVLFHPSSHNIAQHSQPDQLKELLNDHYLVKDKLFENFNYAKNILSGNIFKKINQEIHNRCSLLENEIGLHLN